MKDLWRFIKRVFLFLFVIHILYLLYCKWFNPPITITQISSVVSGYGFHRTFVPLNQISDNAKLAVMASEDQNFPTHNGFDWEAIQKAIQYNEKHPDRTHGASTISQQTAKNVFLWQDRDWVRKGLETYYTFIMEKFYGKKRILELYLNEIEMGKGIFGIEAASEAYFHKHAKDLSPAEAAAIAACLPDPRAFHANPPSRFVQRRIPWIEGQMSHLRNDPAFRVLLK